jgi:four helix bundle protein
MATINFFEELQIWQLARVLYQQLNPVIQILRLNKEFRFAEQLKSAAGSIMDNTAEGFERKSRLEFINSLGVAAGENGEVKSQLYRCLDDNYITEETFKQLSAQCDIIAGKITTFIKYLNETEQQGLKFKNRNKRGKR